MAVINALASLEDVKPVNLPAELDDPLYNSIDPEALDMIVTDKGSISISFTMADYYVQIDGDQLQIHYG